MQVFVFNTRLLVDSVFRMFSCQTNTVGEAACKTIFFRDDMFSNILKNATGKTGFNQSANYYPFIQQKVSKVG